MIKNERQYRITKAQLNDLEEVLANVVAHPEGDPRLQQAEEDALRSQIIELRAEIEEYDALIAGERPVLTLESFAELPQALIKARIASGMSQKDLADRMGLKEQQIQRYEATDYASASLDRLQEVIQALDIRMREEIILPKAKLSFDRLLTRLGRAGIDSKFVLNRLIPRTLRVRIDDPDDPGDPDVLVLAVGSAIARVFGWTTAQIFGSGQLQPNMAVVATTRYKSSKRINEEKTNVYTSYAYYLALLVLEATSALPTRPIPGNPHDFREAVIAAYGSLNFESTLRFVWSLGIPVLPLADAGAFHGACWRVDGRNVIVLKQPVRSSARWLFDLLHEVDHAAKNPDQPSHAVVEHNELAEERVASPEEQAASQFAGDILLQERAEELVKLCVASAGEEIQRLKQAVVRVARNEGVRVDALANYIAFRLSIQGENWWPTANSLQVKVPDPWASTRDVLLEHIDLGILDEADRSLLLQALSQ